MCEYAHSLAGVLLQRQQLAAVLTAKGRTAADIFMPPAGEEH